jgi:hypothetical protein
MRRPLLWAWLSLCACAPEPEALVPTNDAITRSEPEVDCVQPIEPSQLSAKWLDIATDQPAYLAGGAAKLALSNRSKSALQVEVRLKLEAGEKTHRVLESLTLPAEGSAELDVPLSRFTNLAPSAYSAQLLAEVVAVNQGRIAFKTSAEPAYVHRDRSGALLLYSEATLVARFHRGDLERRLRSTAEAGGVAGEVGVARYARAEDLFGDPDDMGRNQKESVR